MLNSIFLRKHTPRWIILTIDLFICAISLSAAYLLRFNFEIPVKYINQLVYVFPIVLSVRLISFLISGVYSGLVRYTTTRDAERIFLVISSGSFLFVIINIISFYFISGSFIIPFSIVIIDFLATIFIMTALRLFVKTLYFEYRNHNIERSNIIIYGVNQAAITTKRMLDREAGSNIKVIAFIDSSDRNIRKKIEGIRIYNSDNLEQILEKKEVSTLIFTKDQVCPRRKSEIVDICLNHDIKILTVPPVAKWINGELSYKQLKNIKIEDLLGRESITLDNERIKEQVMNKTVLVTGAAGSIGSEIVRQVVSYLPKKLILLDQAESPLYDIELELVEKYGFHNFETAICDITNAERMRTVFEMFKPNLVYHAAAYKHVPIMETNPAEAVRTNVEGTKITADLADEFNINKFVYISTDKAVNPTSVMGASKRIGEIYIQALNKYSKTSYITTRFGNVLGSNGSVIPRFKKQIEEGGPITITHPDITRFFMTIPEACQLVLEAGTMGSGGEIYIFDMGESVKIVNLAKKMIKFSGLELGKDIQLQFTGLRPGEKLYEELLTDKENTIPTHHKDILIAKVQAYEFGEVSGKVNDLLEQIAVYDNFELVYKMKKIVPEYKSKNSVYEILDKQEEKGKSIQMNFKDNRKISSSS